MFGKNDFVSYTEVCGLFKAALKQSFPKGSVTARSLNHGKTILKKVLIFNFYRKKYEKFLSRDWNIPKAWGA